jgi:hypothetical protein
MLNQSLLWRQGRPRALIIIVVAIMTTLGSSGCGLLFSDGLPGGARIQPEYVVNRDGLFFAGVRCNTSLTEIGVFAGDRHWPEDLSPYFKYAYWHAASQASTVQEFELFALDQEGVSVISDDGNRVYSTDVFIGIKDSEDQLYRLQITLDSIENGQVFASPGLMSWEEYTNMSDGAFRSC